MVAHGLPREGIHARARPHGPSAAAYTYACAPASLPMHAACEPSLLWEPLVPLGEAPLLLVLWNATQCCLIWVILSNGLLALVLQARLIQTRACPRDCNGSQNISNAIGHSAGAEGLTYAALACVSDYGLGPAPAMLTLLWLTPALRPALDRLLRHLLLWHSDRSRRPSLLSASPAHAASA